MQVERSILTRAVSEALQEDIGQGDVTTCSVIPEGSIARAKVVAREDMVLCGMSFMEEAFMQVDGQILWKPTAKDGMRLTGGATIAQVEGAAAGILTAERTALNYLQRLSGVATLTRQFVDAMGQHSCKLLDTRKTTPGWRLFEKYAVACGGGTNHRMGLHDMVMIKDNHLATLGPSAAQTIPVAIQQARAAYPHLRIEVEADTLEQAQYAMDAGADIILLDNMSPTQLADAVKINQGRCVLEASGGITLANVQAVAASGVDCISIGAVTHSVKAVDIALDFESLR